MLIRNDKQREQSARLLSGMQAAAKWQKKEYQTKGYSAKEVKELLDPQISLYLGIQDDIEIYDKWKGGDLTDFKAASLEALGRFLIASRIAKGVSQRALAQKLGVNESSVSRDERNDYHGVTVTRAIKVLEALGVSVVIEAWPPMLGVD